jgi:hypothetical protein
MDGKLLRLSEIELCTLTSMSLCLSSQTEQRRAVSHIQSIILEKASNLLFVGWRVEQG